MSELTYNEIMDQFNRLNKTKEFIDSKIDDIKRIYSGYEYIVYIGCGSSYSVAKSLALATAMRLNKKSLALPAGDVMLRPKKYKDMINNALVIALSRSGSTSEILLACEKLKKAGANYSLLSLICRLNQPLARISDYSLEMPWAFDKSVCQTSTVSNLYFAGLYIMAMISCDNTLIESLYTIVKHGEELLIKNHQLYQSIAMDDWTCGITLGDSELSGLCEEGALAFKEICQLPSNYYPILDSRHGPIVIIDEDTLVIVAVEDVFDPYIKSFIDDLKKKRCKIVTVSDVELDIEDTINISAGERLDYAALGLLFLSVVQSVTYFKAKHRNVNPDQPDGLDAWIVIESVV